MGRRTALALFEGDELAEVYLSSEPRLERSGNVFLAIVQNVLDGLDCAFVELGPGCSAYLPANAVQPPLKQGENVAARLAVGDEILVQIDREPVADKRARVTMEVGLAGHRVVYLPKGRGPAISARLDAPEERERLRDALNDALETGEGAVARTAARGAKPAELARELSLLRSVWQEIDAKSTEASAPATLYQSPEIVDSTLRDLLTGRLDRIRVDADCADAARLVVERSAPEFGRVLEVAAAGVRVLEERGVMGLVARACQTRHWLKSGGQVVLERTEAMTVVDVNSGKFTRSKSKRDRGLADVALQTNVEAVREVARLLRLRNIGGLAVIDLIDMATEADTRAVQRAFSDATSGDRAKLLVLPISELGLLQVSRQRVRTCLDDAYLDSCPPCRGTGTARRSEWHAYEIMGKVESRATSGIRVIHVSAPRRIIEALRRGFADRIQSVEKNSGVSVQLRVDGSRRHGYQMEVR